MIFKIFNVKHVLDKSKRKKQTLEGYKTEFCWTDDGIHLLLETVNQYNVFFIKMICTCLPATFTI